MTVEPLPIAGCPWPIDLSCLVETSWEEFDPDVQDMAIGLASATLHALSAGQVGGCPITVRPAPRGNVCVPSYDTRWMSPGISARGLWVNNVCGDLEPWALRLPAPIGRVDSIKVDGVSLNLANFRVDDGDTIVYQGSDTNWRWPVDQNLRLPDTDVGTFSVTYLNAYPVDRFAAKAAAHLAVQYAYACTEGTGSRNCGLPSSVTTLVRTGVTMELARGVFPDGFTGVDEVDAWLSVVNPKGRRTVTKVWSPDADEPRIQGRTLGSTP